MTPTCKLVALAALCLADGGAAMFARRFESGALSTTGDATTETTAPMTAAACRRARDLALAALVSQEDAELPSLLHQCTRMLLYAGYKWLDADQATAYCKSDACRQFVAQLDAAVPACAWDNVPSDSDPKLLMAQRVRLDCGGAANAGAR